MAPSAAKIQSGIVVVDDLVELPEVDAVGLEPAQAVFQVGLRVPGGPPADTWS